MQPQQGNVLAVHVLLSALQSNDKYTNLQSDRTQGGPMANILLRRKPVVRVKNLLEDDVYGLWRVKKIVVQKGRQRFALTPKKETFSTKDEAEYYAHLRTQRFVDRRLGLNHHDVQWTAAMTFVAVAAFISVMTVIAVQRFRSLNS